ncbi:MAG: DUF2288 domain-containing protein [Opitutaceae bacterium]
MTEETSNSDFDAEGSTPNNQARHQDFNPAEDTQSDLEKLEKYSGNVDWSYLKPHYEAGSMIYVDPALDLKTAGLAFTNDEKDTVQSWLKSGDLVQPCDLHVEHWIESKTTFNAMIVRPFVLAQPIQ